MYYQVVSHTGSGIVLLREDGSKFEHNLKGAAAPAIGSLFEIPEPPPEGVAVAIDNEESPNFVSPVAYEDDERDDDEIPFGNSGETGTEG